MEIGSKYALSKKIDFVSLVIPWFCPPKTPAIHIGVSESHIIKSVLRSFLNSPSKLVNSVPCFNVLTFIDLVAILSKSYACKGWPISCKT